MIMKRDSLLIAALLIAIILQLTPYFLERTSFEVMPIFTPVSLQYEKMLQEGKSPEESPDILEVVQRLDFENTDPKDVKELKEQRRIMLSLRNERHELNIKMMNNGIEVLGELSPEQWSFVQSNRDAIQQKIELDVLEKTIQKISK
jgi:hypothetical protein